jgi:hypothetical protein
MPDPRATYRMLVTNLDGKIGSWYVDISYPNGTNPQGSLVVDVDGNDLPFLQEVPLERDRVQPYGRDGVDFLYSGLLQLPKPNL